MEKYPNIDSIVRHQYLCFYLQSPVFILLSSRIYIYIYNVLKKCYLTSLSHATANRLVSTLAFFYLPIYLDICLYIIVFAAKVSVNKISRNHLAYNETGLVGSPRVPSPWAVVALLHR